MVARAILVAFAVCLLGLAAAPEAAAAPPCVVGASEPACLVSVQVRECVTDPCDTMDVCVAYGRACVA